MRAPPLVAVLLALGSPALAAGNWATATGLGTGEAAYDASKAICRSEAAPLPPAPAGPAATAGCSSEALYYGIGRPADPEAARRCAMAERAGDPRGDAPFAGDAMLMTMFANGVGAPRDLGVAIGLACTLEGAPAEMDARVRHLDALRSEGPGAEPFGICDDTTSGFLQGECAGHESRIAAAAREAAFAAIAALLAPADKAAFATLRAAMEAFAKARGDNETDLRGSGSAAFEIEAEDAVRDDLLASLRGFGAGTPPAARPLAAEDKALNLAYRAVMAVEAPDWGTPTKAGIMATERAWVAYRDALDAVVGHTFGAASGERAAAALTRQRIRQLQEFLPNAPSRPADATK